jgi:hypothetical protein
LAGENVSVLGFGCMRFPLTEDGKIDREKSAEMFDAAIKGGVNYFDTAYVYHNEESESFLGDIFSDGTRDKIKIATKLPTWHIKSEEDFDKHLNEQLKRLKTDHIDFYLLHALDANRFNNIVMKYDLLRKLDEAKADGRIRHIGFSFHDSLESFKRIIDSNPNWEFCQIQLNYVNTDYQAGLEGLEYARSKGIDVVIMEPLLGGKLAVPAEPLKKVLDPSKSPVEWAFDFLWNRNEVSLLLSGMGALEQVKANIGYADNAAVGMLTDNELEMLKSAKAVFEKTALVPCTRCGYCMPCPYGLDIPEIYEIYNLTASIRKEKPLEMYNKLQVKADKCRKCRACERVCPQNIMTSKLMSKIDEYFNG